MQVNERQVRPVARTGTANPIRIVLARCALPATITVTVVFSCILLERTCFAQLNSAPQTPRKPAITFVHPQPPASTTPQDQQTGQGGASGRHHHHDASESVTNNYIGWGWPTPLVYGPGVTNYYNGVPFGYGSAYSGSPYGGGYGATWYQSQLNNGFAAQPFGGPFQPGFVQPGFVQPGFVQPGFNAPRGLGPVPGIGAPAVAQPMMPAVALPKAIDVLPANDATAEIQRRVDVLKPSTPAGRERADRFLAQGDDQFAAQRYAGAIAKYRDAMAKAPDYPKPHFRLAHSYIASGNFELALTRFLMALELAGSADRINFSLEELYRGDKFAKQTHLERLQDAILREPGDGGLAFLLAMTLHYDQHPLEARQEFVRAQSMPGAHQAYVHLFLPVVPIAEPK